MVRRNTDGVLDVLEHSRSRGLKKLFVRLLRGGEAAVRDARHRSSPPSETVIDDLPAPLLLAIFRWLPAHALFVVGGVSRRWRTLALLDILWEPHVPPEWELVPPVPLPPDDVAVAAAALAESPRGCPPPEFVAAVLRELNLRGSEASLCSVRRRVVTSAEWRHLRWTVARIDRLVRGPLARRLTIPSFFSQVGGGNGGIAYVETRRRSSSSSSGSSGNAVCRTLDQELALLRLRDALRVVRFWSRTSEEESWPADACSASGASMRSLGSATPKARASSPTTPRTAASPTTASSSGPASPITLGPPAPPPPQKEHQPNHTPAPIGWSSLTAAAVLQSSASASADLGVRWSNLDDMDSFIEEGRRVLPGDAAAVGWLRQNPFGYCGRRVDVVADLGNDVLVCAHATKNVAGFRERMYARYHLTVKDDLALSWHRRGERERRPILRLEENAWGASWYSHTSALEQLQAAMQMQCFSLSEFLRVLVLVIGIRVTGGLETALYDLVHVERGLEPWGPVQNGKVLESDPILSRLPALTAPATTGVATASGPSTSARNSPNSS